MGSYSGGGSDIPGISGQGAVSVAFSGQVCCLQLDRSARGLRILLSAFHMDGRSLLVLYFYAVLSVLSLKFVCSLQYCWRWMHSRWHMLRGIVTSRGIAAAEFWAIVPPNPGNDFPHGW